MFLCNVSDGMPDPDCRCFRSFFYLFTSLFFPFTYPSQGVHDYECN